jgi:hypothetical protein
MSLSRRQGCRVVALTLVLGVAASNLFEKRGANLTPAKREGLGTSACLQLRTGDISHE